GRCDPPRGLIRIGNTGTGWRVRPVMGDRVRTTDVVVIGAGQAGLSAIHHLLRHGVRPADEIALAASPDPDRLPRVAGPQDLSFLALDAEPGPGGAWRHRWDSLHTAPGGTGATEVTPGPSPRSTGSANFPACPPSTIRRGCPPIRRSPTISPTSSTSTPPRSNDPCGCCASRRTRWPSALPVPTSRRAPTKPLGPSWSPPSGPTAADAPRSAPAPSSMPPAPGPAPS